jgi:spermidine synthase
MHCLLKYILILLFPSLFLVSVLLLPHHELIDIHEDCYIYKVKRSFQNEKICLRFTRLSDDSQSFQGCVYSDYNNKELACNYTKLTLASLYFSPKPKNILILGLGVGTLPRTFSEIFPNSRIDVVDINKNLNYVNQKYFNFNINDYSNIFFRLADGFDFVKNTKIENKKYDLIINDMFGEDYIPKKFLTNEYVNDLKSIISDDGIVVYNSFTKSKTRELEDKLINDNFGKHYVYLDNNNKIIITNKDNEKISMKKIDKNDQNFSYFKEILIKYGVNGEKLIEEIKYN